MGTIRQEKESIVSVSILMPKEASKSAVSVINGMYKETIGQMMRTLDDQDQQMPTIKHIMNKI